jgi:glyoxylase-like metal-dependent hydrolase (beta-lactamase superfamily II)
MDIFQDGSLLVVDAPGHLPGHINLLARTGPSKYTYLAGDACHDRRILRGELDIGEWHDEHGHICCIHADKAQAKRTIELVRQLEDDGIEVILAHDIEWEEKPENQRRFFGAGK